MPLLHWDSPPKERRDRVRLSALDPSHETLLAGLGLKGKELLENRAFCKAICRERNAWSTRPVLFDDEGWAFWTRWGVKFSTCQGMGDALKSSGLMMVWDLPLHP